MCFGILRSSLGKKYVMAVTGLMLLGFVIAHLAGNLQIFLGADWLNDYSRHLEEMPLLLWPARAVLLAALVLHMATAATLSWENRRARPIPYAVKDTVQASLASRTLLFTGTAVFLFILYHLLHFTWGMTNPEFFGLLDLQGRRDVYSMVILSFQNPVISGVYLAALFILSMHLGHGSWSFLQSLGLTSQPVLKKIRIAGSVLGWLIFIGFASIPLASLLGTLQPLQRGHLL